MIMMYNIFLSLCTLAAVISFDFFLLSLVHKDSLHYQFHRKHGRPVTISAY